MSSVNREQAVDLAEPSEAGTIRILVRICEGKGAQRAGQLLSEERDKVRRGARTACLSAVYIKWRTPDGVRCLAASEGGAQDSRPRWWALTEAGGSSREAHTSTIVR